MGNRPFASALHLMAAGALDEANDRELLARFAAAGDQAAFAALVRRHGALVLGLCRRVLHDNHDAEDAFQATFWILARRAGRNAWHESVRNWLYQVAFRVAREARARRQSRQQREQAARPLSLHAAEPGWTEVSAVLDEELQRLPARYREVLVLCYLEGRTRDEAAQILSTGVGSVKKRLERGRELLRAALERRGFALAAVLLAGALEGPVQAVTVPALLIVSTVRGAAEFAGQTASGPIASLATGVLRTMFMNKLKGIGAGVLVLAALGFGTAATFHAAHPGPAEVVSAEPDGAAKTETVPVVVAKIGQVAVSKPDKLGMVTVFRPMVTRLAAGDPVTVALHFATEDGPIARQSELGDGNHKSPLLRSATVNAMRFTITSPDGVRTVLTLPPKVVTEPNATGLYFGPTFLLMLDDKGLSAAMLRLGEGAGWTVENTWARPVMGLFVEPGVYRIQVSGSLLRAKADGLPFQSGPIAIEIGARGHKSLATAVEAARVRLRKDYAGVKFAEPSVVTENAAGNRLVRFPGPYEGFSRADFIVEVRPDATVANISQRTVGFCVARGTPIETADGARPIEDVRVGDQVWGYDRASRRRVLTNVRLIRPGRATETLIYRGTLRVTASHPIYAEGTWTPAGLLRPHDRLLSFELRPLPAGCPQRSAEPIDVFDLSVDEPHNFFAGGFLVHNKDRDYSPGIDDDWYVLWPPPQ